MSSQKVINQSYLSVQRIFYLFDIASYPNDGVWRIAIHLGMYFSKVLIMKAEQKKSWRCFLTFF